MWNRWQDVLTVKVGMTQEGWEWNEEHFRLREAMVRMWIPFLFGDFNQNGNENLIRRLSRGGRDFLRGSTDLLPVIYKRNREDGAGALFSLALEDGPREDTYHGLFHWTAMGFSYCALFIIALVTSAVMPTLGETTACVLPDQNVGSGCTKPYHLLF